MQKSAHFPPFLRSLRYRSRYKLETERFSIRPIYFNAYFDARYIFHSTTKISPCPRSIEIFHERVGQIRTREFLESSLLFYRDQNLREREREVETSKSRARSKASSAPHQSLNRKRSRAVCRPIWRTSIFLLGYLPPHSTNHDSIFDLAKISSRSKDRAPLFKGGKTEQTGWTVADSRKIFAEWNAELRYPRIKGD